MYFALTELPQFGGLADVLERLWARLAVVVGSLSVLLTVSAEGVSWHFHLLGNLLQIKHHCKSLFCLYAVFGSFSVFTYCFQGYVLCMLTDKFQQCEPYFKKC